MKKDEQHGQFLYDLRLSFGDDSLDKVKTGDRLDNCITDTGADSWIVLDKENGKIEVQLI